VKLTNFSISWLCLGIASLGVLAGCAEGEPIAADFKAVGNKGGHAGRGAGGSLAAGGGSSVENGGSDTSSSGGATGVGGSGGTSSETTDSGSAGSVSGDSGMAGGGAVYDGPLASGLQVDYVAQNGMALGFQVKITNNGADAPPLSSFSIRYFLTSDVVSDASSIVFDDAAWHSGMNMMPYYQGPQALAPKVTYAKLTPTKPKADAYLEFSCSKADLTLGSKDTLEFHLRATANGEDQTNDYSYQAGAALATNPNIVVLQGGSVIAGMAP
jgi:Cellulose binding domain